VLRHSLPHLVSQKNGVLNHDTQLRKLVLTAHITFSVGWLGAVAVFLALAIAGLTSRDPQMVRAAYSAMELTARFVIVPLAIASLFSGLIQSLGTPWGLFRHYWMG
jgi:ABC-type nickel/cobalt efflux system permease component RcnA